MTAMSAMSDDFKPLTQREQALLAGWNAEIKRLREAMAQAAVALSVGHAVTAERVLNVALNEEQR